MIYYIIPISALFMEYCFFNKKKTISRNMLIEHYSYQQYINTGKQNTF